jgi:hypothetical protein
VERTLLGNIEFYNQQRKQLKKDKILEKIKARKQRRATR